MPITSATRGTDLFTGYFTHLQYRCFLSIGAAQYFTVYSRQTLLDRLQGRDAKVLSVQVKWFGLLEDGVESLLQGGNLGNQCWEVTCLLFAIDLQAMVITKCSFFLE